MYYAIHINKNNINKKAPVRRLFEPEAFHLELLRSGKE
jgi:hypothetical protein